MRLRSFLFAIYVCLFLLNCVVLAAQPRRSLERRESQSRSAVPNIFLITIDTLRADHLRCYGYERIQSAAIDQLAKDGVMFSQAFTPVPLTNSAHASILTGLRPSMHGVLDFGIPLDRSHRTIASILKERGFSTAAFIGAVILDSKRLAPGFDAGFDHYANFETPNARRGTHKIERRASEVIGLAKSWLQSQPLKRHFVWIHLYDPHDPYDPPLPYSRIYQGSEYDGEIAYVNEELGRFFSFLKARSEYDDSLIILTADHGEGLGEHGEETHGIFLYDSTLHVPLIVKLPHNKQSGRVIDAQVSTLDIFPTILEAVPAQSSQGEGISLLSLLKDGNPVPRAIISRTDYPSHFGWSPLVAVREKGWKYIEGPRPEFYDLASDPNETQDIYTPWNDDVKRLRSLLEAERGPSRRATSAAAAPESTIEELRALGYLGSDAGSTTAPLPGLLPDPKDKIQIFNLIHLGVLQEQAGDLAKAQHFFEQAAATDPSSGLAFAELGKVEFRARDYRRAVEHLSRARSLLPAQTGITFDLANAFEALGETAAAIELLNAELEANPTDYGARLALCSDYLLEGQIEAAQDQCQAAILLNKDRAEAHLRMARVMLGQGNKALARSEVLTVLRADPKNPEARQLLKDSSTIVAPRR
jgi:arylsulfatase A-like enzyme/Tfp pilus assembly protein PilF